MSRFLELQRAALQLAIAAERASKLPQAEQRSALVEITCALIEMRRDCDAALRQLPELSVSTDEASAGRHTESTRAYRSAVKP